MRMPPVQVSYFPLEGGLNQVTAPLVVPPGRALSAVNFDVDVDGGYRRIAGYSAFDGSSGVSLLYSMADFNGFLEEFTPSWTRTGLWPYGQAYITSATAANFGHPLVITIEGSSDLSLTGFTVYDDAFNDLGVVEFGVPLTLPAYSGNVQTLSSNASTEGMSAEGTITITSILFEY